MSEARDQTRLFGHQAAVQAFTQAWAAGRMPHAWLISGATGIGKATLAYHFARWAMAADRPADKVVLPAQHRLYSQISAGTAPGLLVVEPIEREKTGGVYAISAAQIRGGDDDREGVKQRFKGLYPFFQHSSAADGWRIVIVDQAEQMTEQAANALLKILEEPPARALIFVITSQPGRLLPTIRSRCRQLPLKPLTQAELKQAAQALQLQVPGEAVLAAAEGSLGELQRLTELDTGDLDSRIGALVDGLPQVNWQKVHELAQRIGRKDVEPLFDAAMQLLTARLNRQFKARPAGSLSYSGIMSAIAAVKASHLDRTASLIELFSQLQKIMAVASRAA